MNLRKNEDKCQVSLLTGLITGSSYIKLAGSYKAHKNVLQMGKL